MLKQFGLLLFMIIICSVPDVFAQEEDSFSDNSDVGMFEKYFSIIAGISTAIALGFLAYQTLQLRNERNHTLRAWLGQKTPDIFVKGFFDSKENFLTKEKYQGLNDQKQQEFKIEKTQRYIEFKNFGSVPALNMKFKTETGIDEKPDITSIKIADEEIPGTILMPGATTHLFLYFSNDEESAMLDTTKKFYVLILCTYESPKNNKRKMTTILEFTDGSYFSHGTWDEDIKKSRISWRKHT